MQKLLSKGTTCTIVKRKRVTEKPGKSFAESTGRAEFFLGTNDGL